MYCTWGRPDIAEVLFSEAILEGRPIDVYTQRHMWRAFTYIDDIVEGVLRAVLNAPSPDSGWSSERPDPATSSGAPSRVFNSENSRPVELPEFIAAIEWVISREADVDLMDVQLGDVPATYAVVDGLLGRSAFGRLPRLQRAWVGLSTGSGNSYGLSRGKR